MNSRFITYLIITFFVLLAYPDFAANRKVRIKSRHRTSFIENSAKKDSLGGVLPDTLKRFSRQVVTAEKHVSSKTSLQVDSTQVAESGALFLSAVESITLPSNVEVELGGELQIDVAGQYYIGFVYNSMGFRTRRIHDANTQ